MQYSLTGIGLDFSSYVNGTLNRYDDSSTLNYGMISDRDYNKAYAEYLEHNKLYDDLSAGTYKNSTGQIAYSLECIDNDEIPELVFGRTDQQVQASCYILTYKNGDVKCVGPIGPYNGFSFYESVATADSSECINWNSADNSNNYILLSDNTIEEIKNMK